jgi:hypothetical protein
MRKIIITDLTRFSNDELVCTAGIDIETGECYRPMPYLQSNLCAELNIQPGAILEGNINYISNATNPHVEDANHSNLKFLGAASAEEFKEVLNDSLSNTVSEGFEYDFEIGQKYVPIEETAICSIITIKVSPYQIELHEDQFKPGRVKLSFTDQDGHKFSYISITDRGFYDYAQQHQEDGKLEIQRFIMAQNEIYLRIGLGRTFRVGDRNGCWLQANGIYTFPEYHKEIRSYQ